MNQQLNDLRKQWQALDSFSNINLPPLTANDLQRIQPSTSRLRRHYRVMAIVAAAMIILQPSILIQYAPLEICIAASLYFAIALFFTIRQLILLDKIALFDSTTLEALQHVLRFEKSYNLSQIILILCAIPLLSFMFYYFFNYSIYMLYGGVAGFVIGSLIGWYKDRRIRAHIRHLKQILSSATTNTH